MCRNIKTLFNFEPPASDDEIRASALQFVRKISGYTNPSKVNEAAFHRAVDEVTASARKLLASLATAQPPRNRVIEACEIMRASIEEPVRIGEIAGTLGISARHLQAGFRRHIGKTPRAFLTECRLDLARRKLEQGLPGQSVTATALECGFSNLGEFAGKYRKRFGENPSETLKRAH